MNLPFKMHPNQQHGMALVPVLAIILVLSAVLIFVGNRVYDRQNLPLPDELTTTKSIELNQNFDLGFNQTASFAVGEDMSTLRLKKLDPASNPKPSIEECPELCTSALPKIETELLYSGEKYLGVLLSDKGSIDMSFEENGAYPLVPYEVRLESVDFDKRIATIKVIPKKFVQVEAGKHFTLANDGVAVLEPGKTGIHLSFGVCGTEVPCIDELDFYVNDNYVEVPNNFVDYQAKGTQQYTSQKGATVEYDGIRLRLIDSDDKTYATFVLEII